MSVLSVAGLQLVCAKCCWFTACLLVFYSLSVLTVAVLQRTIQEGSLKGRDKNMTSKRWLRESYFCGLSCSIEENLER